MKSKKENRKKVLVLLQTWNLGFLSVFPNPVPSAPPLFPRSLLPPSLNFELDLDLDLLTLGRAGAVD